MTLDEGRRTGVRLQDALHERVENLAVDAAMAANLAYASALRNLPADVHAKINHLADASADTANALARALRVPEVLTGRNRFERLAIRTRMMVAAEQITLDLIAHTFPDPCPARDAFEATVRANIDRWRMLDVFARELATVRMEPTMPEAELPEAPAEAPPTEESAPAAETEAEVSADTSPTEGEAAEGVQAAEAPAEALPELVTPE